MIKLDLLQTFAEVVRAGSFSAAARRMGVPRSTVSLHIQSLEASLDLRLFKRSTRSLVLTEEGNSFTKWLRRRSTIWRRACMRCRASMARSAG